MSVILLARVATLTTTDCCFRFELFDVCVQNLFDLLALFRLPRGVVVVLVVKLLLLVMMVCISLYRRDFVWYMHAKLRGIIMAW